MAQPRRVVKSQDFRTGCRRVPFPRHGQVDATFRVKSLLHGSVGRAETGWWVHALDKDGCRLPRHVARAIRRWYFPPTKERTKTAPRRSVFTARATGRALLASAVAEVAARVVQVLFAVATPRNKVEVAANGRSAGGVSVAVLDVSVSRGAHFALEAWPNVLILKPACGANFALADLESSLIVSPSRAKLALGARIAAIPVGGRCAGIAGRANLSSFVESKRAVWTRGKARNLAAVDVVPFRHLNLSHTAHTPGGAHASDDFSRAYLDTFRLTRVTLQKAL